MSDLSHTDFISDAPIQAHIKAYMEVTGLGGEAARDFIVQPRVVPFDYDIASAMAIRELNLSNEGVVIPSYLRMENPAILERDGGTFFDLITELDADGEFVGESGSVLQLVEAIDNQGNKYGVGWKDVSERFDDLLLDNEGISAWDLRNAFRDIAEEVLDPDTGEIASPELFRAVMEDMGHDGIILDAFDTFGPNRYRGNLGRAGTIPGMKGVTEGTKHYLIFDPRAAKSPFNRGGYDPDSPNILLQDRPPIGPLPPGSLDNVGGPEYQGIQNTQGFGEQARPLLDELLSQLLDPGNQQEFSLAGLGDEGSTLLNRYLRTVESEMATSKLGTIRWGENRRDAALLPYHKRTQVDGPFELWKPYQFFFTRSVWEWFKRTIDHPSWVANYLRIRRAQQNTYRQPGFPTRMRNKVSIPAPYLPEWAGGQVFVDPVGKTLPPDIFLSPMDRIYQQRNQVVRRAEYVLQRQAQDGTLDPAEVATAISSKAGELWETAMVTAQDELGAEDTDPLDYVNLMLGNGLVWEIMGNLMSGTPEELSVLPVTRTGQSMRTLFEDQPFPMSLLGMMGSVLAKPEEYIRETNDISIFGEWGDYFVDRQMSNMAADGEWDVDDVLRAQIEKTGPIYEEAFRRVELEQTLKTPFSQTVLALQELDEEDVGIGDLALSILFGWMPANLLPTGELKQRGLKEEYNAAYVAYNLGDKTKLNTFFDDNPEYATRLALWAEPEERLRQFLISSIWEKYYSLDGINTRLAREQLGDVFQQTFLSKETRDYTAIDLNTLSLWSQALGVLTPASPAVTRSDEELLLDSQLQTLSVLNLAPNDQAKAVQKYYDLRQSEHPNWYALQQRYFGIDGRSGRAKFLQQFPELAEYWDFARDFKVENPALLPWLEYSKYIFAQEDLDPKHDPITPADGLEKYLTAFWKWHDDQPRFSTFGSTARGTRVGKLSGIPDPLKFKLSKYYTEGRQLSFGAVTNLKKIWATSGYPAGDFWIWINVVLPQFFGGFTSKAQRATTQAPAQSNAYVFNPDDFSAPMMSKLTGYYLAGQTLGDGSLRTLRRIYDKRNVDVEFQEWLDVVLKDLLVAQQTVETQ